MNWIFPKRVLCNQFSYLNYMLKFNWKTLFLGADWRLLLLPPLLFLLFFADQNIVNAHNGAQPNCMVIWFLFKVRIYVSSAQHFWMKSCRYATSKLSKCKSMAYGSLKQVVGVGRLFRACVLYTGLHALRWKKNVEGV